MRIHNVANTSFTTIPSARNVKFGSSSEKPVTESSVPPEKPPSKFRQRVKKYGLVGTLLFFTVKGIITTALGGSLIVAMQRGCNNQSNQTVNPTAPASK